MWCPGTVPIEYRGISLETRSILARIHNPILTGRLPIREIRQSLGEQGPIERFIGERAYSHFVQRGVIAGKTIDLEVLRGIMDGEQSETFIDAIKHDPDNSGGLRLREGNYDYENIAGALNRIEDECLGYKYGDMHPRVVSAIEMLMRGEAEKYYDAIASLRADSNNPNFAVVLSGANFAGAKLQKLDLADAILRGACFSGALIFQAKFDGADLGRALFNGATLVQCSFVGANLKHATLSGATSLGGDFTEANLEEAFIYGTGFMAGSFVGAIIDREHAERNGSHFTGTIKWGGI
ncbi:MAG: pentapeptide repeat-containing protein [Candidatus Margulisiibacteriota bacterium]